jgi:lactate dehydrogenase-like 2-hydroxyacid dehydrogenase
MTETLLQLCPVLPATQTVLDRTYTVLRMPSRDAPEAERNAWLDAHGAKVRAVVTGGHLGIETALAERLPNLGIVAVNGVGYDRIDIEAMRRLDVRVSNTPDVLTDDVADLAIALMLNVMRRLPAAEAHVRDGSWPTAQPALARRASGLRYGIVGFGRIGQAIAARLAGFGGSIAYTGPRRKQTAHAYHDDLRALAAASDVLFVATAASAATARIVDRAVLDALGPQGVLVNIARGSIVDETALVEALIERRIWGAGLDVFENEPHVPPALLGLENVSLAPHVGSATGETRQAMGALMLDNLAAFFDGRALPTQVV